MQQFDEFLIDLEREALAHVLSELVARHPELRPEAEALCEAALTVYSAARAVTPVELAVVQTTLRGRFRSGGSRFYGGIQGAIVAEAAAPWLEKAREHLAAGEGAAALELLALVTDEIGEAGDTIYDEGGELDECVLEIGDGMAKALLLSNLTTDERKAWESRIETWSETLGVLLAPEALRRARLAARHGWEYPPLVAILRGEAGDTSGYANRTGGVVPVLGPVMLEILEQQGRREEFGRLSAALSGAEP